MNAPHLGEWLGSPRAAHSKPQPSAGTLSYDLSIGIGHLGCMDMNTWPFANKGACVCEHIYLQKNCTQQPTGLGDVTNTLLPALKAELANRDWPTHDDFSDASLGPILLLFLIVLPALLLASCLSFCSLRDSQRISFRDK